MTVETEPPVERTLEEAEQIKKYDLMPKMIPFLDKHMVLLMLQAHLGSSIYKKNDIVRAMIRVGMQTSLVGMVEDSYAHLGEEVPSEVYELRDRIVNKVSEKREDVLQLLEILENEDQVKKIPDFKSIEEMADSFQIPPEMVDDLAMYAKLQYECGDYRLSAELLKHYRSMPHSTEMVSSKQISCLWGLLASIIGVGDTSHPDKATELIFKIDEYLDSSKAPKSEVLMHKTWLVHWALFTIFSSKFMDPKLMDFFLNEKSLSIISLSCPHLFRYVGACLILQKRLKHLVKDTVWIIHHEAANYSDPVTRFLLALYTEMDYDEAQRELQNCEMVCAGDYFLQRHWAEFQENARLHIFESYCRIHQCINIEMIASKLNMGAEEAELWIVKLIQNAKLDARIDSEKKRVVMTKAPPNVHQQVIEKTKNLAFRSTMLVSNMEKDK